LIDHVLPKYKLVRSKVKHTGYNSDKNPILII